jgi:hypothetical protein
MPDRDLRRVFQRADKYAREKEYCCLVPGCNDKAIWSHSIPRSACVEALAEKGTVYTRPMSFNTLRMTVPSNPPAIAAVGVKLAGVFRGYCARHDAALFASAETTNHQRKRAMFIALHLRALSVEYCRKRQVLEYYSKIAECTTDVDLRSYSGNLAQQTETFAACFEKIYLGSLFNLIGGSDVDSVDYFCLPFSRNLQVSCCGCFDGTPGAFDSVIAYNLISYADMTLLVLTTFNVVKHYLDAYLAQYALPKDCERLINDIAFFQCEEPLISPRLWRSLSENQQTRLRLSLRHPAFRTETAAPSIIRIAPTDFVNNVTPAILARLGASLKPSEGVVYSNKPHDPPNQEHQVDH